VLHTASLWKPRAFSAILFAIAALEKGGGMADGKRGVLARGIAVAGVLGGLLAGVLTLTGQLKEAWILCEQVLVTAARPYHHVLLKIESARKAMAGRLLAGMYANELCFFQALAADLSESGWEADLIVSYAEKPEGEDCSSVEPRGYITAFVPDGLSLTHMGTENADTAGFPYGFEEVGRFVFQNFFGTDWPFIEVWYAHGGELRHGEDIRITLADAAENEYELKTKLISGGLLAWGTPDGLFHLLVTEGGRLTRRPGLPPAMARRDVLAVSLHWDGSTFRVPPQNAQSHSWAPVERESWPEFDAIEKDKESNVVTVLRLSPLDRLYVSGCETVQGFLKAEKALPGAIMPRFSEAPVLRCGGSGREGETFEIRVEPRQR
jgi:hypothetical protein